jgi:hypothetical protein
VAAVQEGLRVALFDLNADQGDLTKWLKLPGEPKNPRLIEVEHISKDIEVLRSGKFDTPPLDLDVIKNAIMKSDAVVVPVRSDGPILATQLRYLQPYILSIHRGKSAAEIDRTIALEIDRLWAR